MKIIYIQRNTAFYEYIKELIKWGFQCTVKAVQDYISSKTIRLWLLKPLVPDPKPFKTLGPDQNLDIIDNILINKLGLVSLRGFGQDDISMQFASRE